MFTNDSEIDNSAIPLPRTCVARWIFVGDRVTSFTEWLSLFAETHAEHRLEGHVLDFSKGKLLAELDMSEVTQSVYDDIGLQLVEPRDHCVVRAFLKLLRRCNPITLPNKLTLAFDAHDWPELTNVCVRIA